MDGQVVFACVVLMVLALEIEPLVQGDLCVWYQWCEHQNLNRRRSSLEKCVCAHHQTHTHGCCFCRGGVGFLLRLGLMRRTYLL